MIRTVTVAVIGLAGLGALAAAGRRSTPPPPPPIVFPVSIGNKADRLPIMDQSNLTSVDRVEVAYVPALEESKIALPPPAPEAESTKSADFVPRHWHDPHDSKAKAARQRNSAAKQSRERSPDKPARQAANASDCRSDGLQPLLQKLNLAPPGSC